MRYAAYVSLAVLAAAALAHYVVPTGADQSMYAVGARVIHHGGQINGPAASDFADHHGPGTYLLYWLAGQPLSLRRLEIVMWLGAGLVAMLGFGPGLTRGERGDPLLWAIPWAAAAGYVFGSSAWTGGQPPSLATPFVIVAASAVAWSAHEFSLWGGRNAVPKLLLGGASMGMGISCDPELAFIALGLTVLIGVRAERALRPALAFVAGIVLCLVWIELTLGLGTWARFVGSWWELHSSRGGGWFRGHGEQIAQAVRWTVRGWPVWLALAGVGLIRIRQSAMASVCTVWAAGTIVAYLIDPFGWWVFKIWPLIPATGLLGLVGLDALLGWFGLQRWRAVIVTAVVAVSVVPLFPRWWDAAQQSVAQSDGRIDELHEEIVQLHRYKFPPETGLYSIGDPYLEYISDRPRVARRTGWAGELYGPSVWREVRDMFDTQSSQTPPSPFVVVVDPFHERMLATHAPELLAWLDDHCQGLFKTPARRWMLCADVKPPPIELERPEGDLDS